GAAAETPSGAVGKGDTPAAEGSPQNLESLEPKPADSTPGQAKSDNGTAREAEASARPEGMWRAAAAVQCGRRDSPHRGGRSTPGDLATCPGYGPTDERRQHLAEIPSRRLH